MPEKELWGIYIRKEITLLEPIDKKNWDTQDSEISYWLSLGKWRKGYREQGLLFVPNKSLQEKVQELIQSKKFEEIRGQWELGRISVFVNRMRKLLTTISYYPFLRSPLEKDFRKLGIASLAEYQIEKELLKEFPKYKIRPASIPSMERSRQLRGRGRKPGKKIPIKQAAELTRQYVIRKHREKYGLPEIKIRPLAEVLLAKKKALATTRRPLRRA